MNNKEELDSNEKQEKLDLLIYNILIDPKMSTIKKEALIGRIKMHWTM